QTTLPCRASTNSSPRRRRFESSCSTARSASPRSTSGCVNSRSNSTSAGTCSGSVAPCARPVAIPATPRYAPPTRSRATWAERMTAREVDGVIVGGGHNALVAAAYLGRAGLRVRLLERLPHVGGAAVSSHVFDGVDARLSRYAYLVSLLPARILDDLGATVRLARRPYSSYTPDPATAGRTGLLVGPRSTFDAIDAHDDERAFAEFYRRCRLVTERLWPTMLEPLRTREQARATVVGSDPEAAAAWQALVERPVGAAIADAVHNDVVRGVVATDALIGTFARLDDASLQQNICFLYHLIGGGVGDWHVPIGGMGAVSAALAAAASAHGGETVTGAEGYAIGPAGEVRYRCRDDEHAVRARLVLAGVTPASLAGLLGEPAPASVPGAQVKVNMVLRRLPRLRDDSVSPE